MAALIEVVELHLTTLLKDFATAPEQTLLLETWSLYQKQDKNWLDGTSKAWRAALKPEVPQSTGLALSSTLELVSTEIGRKPDPRLAHCLVGDGSGRQ